MKFYSLVVILIVLMNNNLFSQAQNNLLSKPPMLNDTIRSVENFSGQLRDSVIPLKLFFRGIAIENLIKQNKFLDLQKTPSIWIVDVKKQDGKEFLFYVLSLLVLITGILKAFYSRYFSTIFRVYFNTSLRQNQLSDLLIQAKLPSLIFNILFFISGGIYSWEVLTYYHLIKHEHGKMLIIFAFLSLCLLYIGKYCILKFVGWVTGTSAAVDTYLFIVFLINKISGILLIPFVVLLAFSPKSWQSSIIFTSLSILTLLFFSRYFRSYDLIKQKINFEQFHFIFYIIAIEIIPLLILTKTMVKLLM